MEEYMPAAELEDCFEHAALQGAALLPTEIEFLRIRRRLLSLERAGSDASHDQPASRPCKAVVLGDESSSGKISMLELLCLHPSGTGVVSADVVQASRAGFPGARLTRPAPRGQVLRVAPVLISASLHCGWCSSKSLRSRKRTVFGR